jgi:hypothetical protein
LGSGDVAVQAASMAGGLEDRCRKVWPGIHII